MMIGIRLFTELFGTELLHPSHLMILVKFVFGELLEKAIIDIFKEKYIHYKIKRLIFESLKCT